MSRRWPSGAVAGLLFCLCLPACPRPRSTPPPPPPAACALVECDGACVDVRVDAAHCGGCGRACQTGEVCSVGVCTVTCEAPLAACRSAEGVRCAAVLTDSANCGACGVTCGPSEICAGGGCAHSCSAPFSACGDGEGAWCADLSVDRLNCGACGQACPVGQSCLAGVCTPGCEGPGRASCGDACVDLFSDDRHCGGCEIACSTTERCDRAACRDVCALEGLPRCGALCVDLERDESNCGVCGKRCPAGGACRAGLCQGPICAGGPFLPGRPDLSDSVVAQKLLAGDFDGDGRVDLLLPEFHGARIQLLHGLEGGGFGAPVDAIASAGVPLVAADVDGDGDQDVLVGGQGSILSTYLNDGSGHLGLASTEAFYGAVGALVEDLDNDGRPDLLAYGDIVKIWFSSGAQATPSVTQLCNVMAVRAADLDGDGRLDLISGMYGGKARMLVLMNQGGGVFGPPQVVLGQIPDLFALRVADLDGDGRPDAVAMGWDTITIWRNVGGALMPQATLPLPDVMYRYDLLVADLDGDARPEVVVGESEGFRVFRNRSDGTFGPEVLLPGSPAQTLAAFDVDHDGRVDLVAASAPAGGVEVRRQLASGGFEGPERLSIAADQALFADLDGDGLADLVSLSRSSGGGPPIGTLEVRLSGAPRAPPRSMTGLGWSSVQSGDLDGDGDIDLLLASAGAPGVLLNRGDGSFEAEVPVMGLPSGAALADVDGDGALDLVALDFTGSPRRLSVARGLRNGAFRPPVKTPVPGDSWRYLTLGDVDGDGRADAVLVDDIRQVMHVSFGGADGAFGSSTEIPLKLPESWPSVRGLVVRDLDADGRAEIVALFSGYRSEVLVVVRGSVPPLAAPELTTLSGGHGNLAVASLMGGAHAQVILGSWDSVGVLVGQADGGFAPEVRWAATGVSSLAVGDVDGDLRDDVAALRFDSLLLFHSSCPAQ